jgi:hypothetical protein
MQPHLGDGFAMETLAWQLIEFEVEIVVQRVVASNGRPSN